MRQAEIAALSAWTAEIGLKGRTDATLVHDFIERARGCGLPLARAVLLMDTLHPNYEGRAYRWALAAGAVEIVDYASTLEGEAAERWRASTFYRMWETNERSFRRRLDDSAIAEYPPLGEYRDAGMTDYLATIRRFTAVGVIGEMDCFYAAWMTDAPDGFSDAEIAALERLTPFLGLAIKAATLSRIAGTLVETYLGRDAGRRVLSGRINRGVADRIKTVLWFSDLRNYTRISDSAEPDQIIPLLNDYADAVVTAIQDHSGDVLKLIGDGVLAIFPAEDRAKACAEALHAAREARAAVADLNARRTADGLPTTDMYLGLHIGMVFYGNIGSRERLDFTVVGPAVNEVSRVAAMCRSVDQPILLSSAFVESFGAGGPFVSVGRFALRGVGRPQALYTLDAEADGGLPSAPAAAATGPAKNAP